MCSLSTIIGLVIAILALLFRRFVWNFFRLENEHLNNCGEFRAVRDIKIKPLDIPKAVPSSAQLNTKPDVSKYVTTSYESNV